MELIYLDTCVMVPMLLADAFTPRVEEFLLKTDPRVCISDFGAAEFSAVITRKLRTRELSGPAATAAFAAFDRWRETQPIVEMTGAADISDAERLIRRPELALRTPDAIHIAIARRLGARLATFDSAMAHAAQALGLPLAAL